MAGSADLAVACVLNVGEFRGRNYGPDWVVRLRNMVARNLTLPHRFVCLSNVPVGDVETIPLVNDWPGWWSKVELFAPHLAASVGRALYLDLDVLITGNLDEIASHPAPFAIMPPHQCFVENAREYHKYQSSCMVWSPPAGREIYERFTPDVMRKYRGDQDWIEHIMPDLPTMPVKWFNKLRVCPAGPPPGTKVILSMPWKCNVAAQKFDWVRDVWQ